MALGMLELRRPMKIHYPCFAAIAALLGVTSAYAQSFVYTDFSNPSGLQINGNAAVVNGVPGDGKVLRLTPANFSQSGSAFSTTQITLGANNSFSTEFSFRITGSGGASDNDGLGADGIMFVVQPVSNNVGTGGGGIGYQGIPTSLGIEFDTWNNGGSLGDQNDGNHVAVNTNGNLTDMFLTHISTPMNNGALWYSWIDYNGATNALEVRLSQTSVRPGAALIQTNSIDLSTTLGTNSAYVGFTSGTGAAYGNHDITSWQFNDDYHPIQVVGAPDSASTLLLLAGSLSGLLMIARRRSRA
jgi:hypothetical protein